MICYRKTAGIAHDLRLVSDAYKAGADEIVIAGDSLPALESLCDAEVLTELQADRVVEAKRNAALRSLEEARLVEALLDPGAPQAVKDYAQCVL